MLALKRIRGGALLNIPRRHHTSQPAFASFGAGAKDETVDVDVRHSIATPHNPGALAHICALRVQDEPRRRHDGRDEHPQAVRYEEIWCGWHNLLQKFVDEKRRLPKQGNELYQGRNLGVWCANQRVKKRNGKLNSQRAQRLEGIRGCEWVWDYILSWEESFDLLQEYVEEKGKLPKQGDERYQGRNLYNWCIMQRVAKRNGELSLDRAQRLEAIRGCKWVWDYILSWEGTFDLVQEFVEEEGRLPKRDEERYQGRNLGDWCNTQRVKKRNGKLNSQRAQRLEGIRGCKWVWDYTVSWEESFDLVQKFFDEEGRLPKLGDEPYQGQNLGVWCDRQRVAKRNGELSLDRAQRLEGIRGCKWVWDYTLSWEESFDLVQEFLDEEGRLPKWDDDPYQGRNLYSWCNDQRRAKRNGTLPPHRAERLEGIRGCEWAWDYTLTWEGSFRTPTWKPMSSKDRLVDDG